MFGSFIPMVLYTKSINLLLLSLIVSIKDAYFSGPFIPSTLINQVTVIFTFVFLHTFQLTTNRETNSRDDRYAIAKNGQNICINMFTLCRVFFVVIVLCCLFLHYCDSTVDLFVFLILWKRNERHTWLENIMLISIDELRWFFYFS